ncbi:hypothetical protein, partial [Helicobacter turcicus]
MKICIIMPIYPAHFGYANEFISSFFKYEFDKQADLIFVFTNEDELKEFKTTNFKGYYKSLVLPEFLRVSKQQGIINIKKFFALLSLKDAYKYSLIVDSESEFIKSIDLLSLFDEFYAKKILYGNETRSNPSDIQNASKKFFEKKFIKKKFENEKLYLWFNQPCIYKNAYLGEFFKAINMESYKDLLALSFLSFDYYIYMYFLIFYKDFKVVNLDILSHYGALEAGCYHVFKSQKFKQIPFLCSNPSLAKELCKEKLFLYIQKNGSYLAFKSKEDLNKEILNLKKELAQSTRPGATMRAQNFLSYKLGVALI